MKQTPMHANYSAKYTHEYTYIHVHTRIKNSIHWEEES